MASTRIEAMDGGIVAIPNNQFLEGPVTILWRSGEAGAYLVLRISTKAPDVEVRTPSSNTSRSGGWRIRQKREKDRTRLRQVEAHSP